MPGSPPDSFAHLPSALIPGQCLAERYLIEDTLGRGAMGQVYRARDEQTGQRVAIKTILPVAGGDAYAPRFRREFRALKRLRHPHVIAVHDSGQVDGLPFYVMEYVEGPDLARLLKQRGAPLTVAETVTIGAQIGQALAYIHNQGLIHRDVKPSNIMLLAPDQAPPTQLHAKLMDFGLVKMADVSAQLTASGVWMGTLKYMAPEQVKGLSVDRRSDLYALGLVLFELCTDDFPFHAPDPLSLALQRLTVPPLSPWELQPDLPPPLSAAILKLLAEDLGERYASAEELLADLEPLAVTAVVLEPPPLSRADRVVESPLIGRDDELERLHAWLQAAWTGPGQFVLVAGEAGVGKTRLLQELAGLARQGGSRRLTGGCYEEERLPYGPFAEALRGVIGRDDGRFASLLQGLRPELARLVPDLIVSPAEGTPALEPEQARLRLFDAVTRFLVRLSRRRPLILVLEDLHWADEGTLELLHYLVRNSQGASLFICGTARQEELDEEHPLVALLQGMGRRGLVERLPLKRLSPAAVADLVAGMLAGGPPPPRLAERLYREAEGNPFFVEEMLRAWVEEGRLAWESGHWSLVTGDAIPGVSALSIPASIADVVARRLRGVPGTQMGLLELAAVLGREFNFDVLLHMAPGVDEDTLLDAVEDLLRARLLEEVQHSHEDRYRFVHNKIQEVIYARASRRRLRRWHREAGQALVKVYAGRLERVIEPLARHFLEAGDRRGVGYGLRAGDAARAVYANREALWYYGRALELAAGLRERGENGELAGQVVALHSGMARVHFLIGEYGAASACYWTVLELLPEAELEADERRQRTAATHRRLADVYEAQGHYEEAMIEFRAALDTLQIDVGISRELARIYQRIGWLQWRRGNYREAIVSCDEGKRVAPPGDHAVVAELDDTLGVIYGKLGEYDHAAACHQRSLALREQLDDQAGIAKTCNNLAVVSRHQGDYEQAIAYNRRSLDISERIGHVTGVAWLHNNLGNLYYAQGEYNQAIDSYHRALTTHERIGNQLGIVTALGNLGWACLKQGGLARAVEYAQAALSKSAEIGDREGVASTHHLLAEIYLAQGDPAQAIHSGQQALEIATDIGARLYQAEAHQVLGQACTELGQRERACTHVKAAWRIFCDLGDEERATATKETLDTLNCQGERDDINE